MVGNEHLQQIHPARSRLLLWSPPAIACGSRRLSFGRDLHPAAFIDVLQSKATPKWPLRRAWRVDLVSATAHKVKTSADSGRVKHVRRVKLGNLLKSLVESEKIESTSELKGGSNPRGRSLRPAPVPGGNLG